MATFRMTYASAMVLQALADGYRYGLDIADATGIRTGTVYPILRRLEDLGMARGRWESTAAARSDRRPARRYYQLTPSAGGVVREARSRFPSYARLPAANEISGRPKS